ncbi:hypothetical protein F4677DRAFT_418665 [Hypoxylon crocopeplum]|nr:hypothetical protein F4677DRAFT_418665 [Hypoxylon crocopeplum]
MESDSQSLDLGAMSQHNPRKRTRSMASTASIHSVTTQPNLDQPGLTAHHGGFTDQWSANEHGQQKDMSSAGQPMQAGDMMLRPASRLQTTQSFPVDSTMHSAVGSTSTYHQHQGLHHAVPSETFGANASFTDADSQMMDRDDGDDGDSHAGPPASSRAGSSRTSANNELEMRQLFQSNKNRTLCDVATELHGNERGPNSERARQIFAMLWISQVCSKGNGSVPRGRVYANYASRCGTERITVLNPASFGKLVRVLFPGLKTRRLGVRGESKYHYVNFMLADDQPELQDPAPQPALPFPESTSFAHSLSAAQSQSPALNAHNSAFPSPTMAQQFDAQAGSRPAMTRTHSLFNQPDVNNVEDMHSTNVKTTLRYAFVPEDEEPFKQGGQAEPLTLPSIEPFLPPGTDPDAAKSLTALYRAHCTSLIECIRYCKEKTFFHLYTSFQGTLTMPVQKLFSNPSVAPWIEECDFMLYQRIMRLVISLTLQVVPKSILDTFRNISDRLVLHIRESFQGQPKHVILAKETPASLFTSLLDRSLRVNLSAHAAANMLSTSTNRDQMYLDWITTVKVRKVAESVPTRGMDDVVELLVFELRKVINPVNVPWDIESRTIYGDVLRRFGRDSQAPDPSDDNVQNVIDRWVAFVQSLPRRFPYATATDIVAFVQIVGADIMRDLTIGQAKSFGSWWVTKCWVDEMVMLLAEYGGFMKTKTLSSTVASAPKLSATNHDESQRGSRLSTGSEDLNLSRLSQPQPDRAPFPSQLEANGQDPPHLSANPDDSGIGIGIRTPEEDYPMDKFEFQQSHGQGLQSLGLSPELQ